MIVKLKKVNSMKTYRFSIFILTFIFIYSFSLISYSQEESFNCFSVIVGKDASKDGSVMFAHNEDDWGDQIVNFYRVPRIKHKSCETITLSTGAVIQQVAETFSYIWLQMPKMNFSDSYINEWGVTIGTDACSSREENPSLTEGGIKYRLRGLIAERARNAKHGVKIAGELIEKLGYASSGRTYCIADPNEGWMMAIVNGKHWVAQRIPDDKIAVLPNYYTIRNINLSDTTNFLGSFDIIDYAITQGWYDSEKDGEFDFAKIYSRKSTFEHKVNIRRMWRGINLLTEQEYAIDDRFPFAFEPTNKVDITDLMALLRDHLVGTKYDPSQSNKLSSPNTQGSCTICAAHTQYGFVAQLRNWMPVEIGAVLWLAPRRPDAQAYVPWYSGMTKIPANFAYGDYKSALIHHFNPDEAIYEKSHKHAFWSYAMFADWVDNKYYTRIEDVQTKWHIIENDALRKQAEFELKVLKVYKKKPKKAKKMLTKYSIEWIEKTLDIVKEID